MTPVFNFSAGPAVLPKEVLLEVQQELLDWHGSGMSVMEMSHRGREFMQIAAEAEEDLRSVMGIPGNYRVLFLQGGATTQFAMVPMNLLRGRKHIDFIETGHWSKLAMKEARKFGEVQVAASGEDRAYTYVPAEADWQLNPNAAYVHYTSNETLGGVEFPYVPSTGDTPLVCDMSSNFLSRPVDVSKFGLIYGGAQKNIGPAGLTIVIVREDLLGQTLPGTPTMFDYKIQAEGDSMYNTPPTFAIYVAGLVFKWIQRQGGLKAIEQRNIEKAALLYETIDTSDDFYNCPVEKAFRSRMNVPFKLNDVRLDEDFIKQASARNLLQIKGHRVTGGMRASIYNAMPLEGVKALTGFMQDFARNHG
ncbi:3-phosphoserine/phosphohydroxythreonine transaminase [Chitinimonas sp. BJB300]|uniref:3-phosphoserine/phosphohydroxythreonine transaminase n=1 Tax=Chitinimonas sp. BJB300 TaxID=1559339 RepID=UPI000C0CB9C4|nr:3-phosphoserine/phosphohydroxythreonine transaminase [Chitinimonas sp. BJB300]PHV11018.1 3-phosphoserine/phosphohydroxythreonine aminotransferase [Chitinimonas sp. BJB300]TSJ86050.1 3-phosphoserine/phosphohydroxythreonine transaminase [Chitinimonas sp. BJB300]